MVRRLRFSLAMACLLAAPAGVCAGEVSARADGARTLQSYGRHLASECTACHRPDAGAGAIPSIAGKPAPELIGLLEDFRAGRKTNPIMVSVAKSLDEEEMSALAAYFASLPKPPSRGEDAR